MKDLCIHVMLKFAKNSNREYIIFKSDLYPVIGQLFRNLSVEITSNAMY